MTILDPEQAYQAVVEFLDEHWRRRPVPGDFGDFDWLAWVRKLQTGILAHEDRGRLSAEMMQPLDPEQAYLAMFEFIREYWERVSRPAEIGDLLGRMQYTPGAGTADPEMWKRWLAAVEKVQAKR